MIGRGGQHGAAGVRLAPVVRAMVMLRPVS